MSRAVLYFFGPVAHVARAGRDAVSEEVEKVWSRPRELGRFSWPFEEIGRITESIFVSAWALARRAIPEGSARYKSDVEKGNLLAKKTN